MEDPIPYRKPHSPNPGLNISATHSNPITQGKSYLQFLLKALFFVVLVMVLPLFPSQPPEFVGDRILDKFWELIHLLFIGIAVSYGLFSRRNVEVGVENCSNVENLESYMPRMFDGCDNPCGSGEKRVFESWNSQNFVGNHVSTVYFDAQCKPRLLNYGDGVEISCGFKNKNVAQASNAQYFQGESMVFVAQPDYAVDGIVKPKSVFDDEPLRLPIRSLKSRVKNPDKSEFGTRSESGFGSNAASNSFDWSRNRSYGDLAPINLLEKFNQAMASPSPILQRSSSRKMERGKRVGSATCPSHFRPLSVDEAQLESLKTRSFRSTLSFSSQTSSKSSSPEKEFSSVDSISSELLNSETVHLGKRKKSSRASSPSGLPSEPTPMNEKVSHGGLHSRSYSIGSFFEDDLKKSSENYLKKELNGSRITGDQYDSGKKELGIGSFKSEKKPAVLTKSSLRGKSVRTIRGSRLTTHDKVENNQKMFDNGEAVFMRKEKMQNGGADNPSQISQMSKPAFPKYQKEQMQDFFDHVDVRSEEESESEVETFEVSSEDRVEAAAAAAFCNSVNVVAGPDSEVDKKASEFIAKFREQIRLQKVASIDRSRGLSLGENRFR
ncbi:hypothetical protein ACLB2K_073891 [Fragaria x ananassa]